MNMNIYITKANQEYLKSLPSEQSMSGLINDLLDNVRNGKTPTPNSTPFKRPLPNIPGLKTAAELMEPKYTDPDF